MAISLKLTVFLVSLFVCFQGDITSARQMSQRYSYLQRLHEARVDKRLPWKDRLQESRAHNMRQQPQIDGFEITPGIYNMMTVAISISVSEIFVGQEVHVASLSVQLLDCIVGRNDLHRVKRKLH